MLERADNTHMPLKAACVHITILMSLNTADVSLKALRRACQMRMHRLLNPVIAVG